MTAALGPSFAMPDPVFRLSVEQYHAMIQAGILATDDSVELIDGWLIRKMSQNPPHSVSTELAADRIRDLGLHGWCVRSEKPITLADSEPEPDVVVARGATRDYANRHPSAGEVGMLIEVADSSLEQDRVMKRRVYARAAIAVYWIVNLSERHVEVYTKPSGAIPEPAYGQRQDYPAGAQIQVVLGGQQVGSLAVSDLLP